MAKKQGFEAAAQRLEAEFARLEQVMQELVSSIEADEREDQTAIRAELERLYQESRGLLERLEALRERAAEVAGRTEKTHEVASQFHESFESTISDVDTALEQLSPDTWDWGDQQQ